MKRDRLFETDKIKKFTFDESVASVFDDMIDRSVPFYKENIELILSFVCQIQRDGMRVLDLGSSTGTFLFELEQRLKTKAQLIGIDNSSAMLKRAKEKAVAFGSKAEFSKQDIIKYDMQKQDLIVANYTLQFIPPKTRREVVKKIQRSLGEDGIFIFCEKIGFEPKWLDEKMVQIYYDFKKDRGYSDYEIARKKEALEDVLIPFDIEQNIQMCKDAGFKETKTLFQWANFVTFLATSS